jgi:hypothetical protein
MAMLKRLWRWMFAPRCQLCKKGYLDSSHQAALEYDCIEGRFVLKICSACDIFLNHAAPNE